MVEEWLRSGDTVEEWLLVKGQCFEMTSANFLKVTTHMVLNPKMIH